jgi:hypothetical protein
MPAKIEEYIGCLVDEVLFALEGGAGRGGPGKAPGGPGGTLVERMAQGPGRFLRWGPKSCAAPAIRPGCPSSDRVL